jgi:hypothetical protein
MSSEITTQEAIVIVCDSIRDMLVDKNRKYGDSAISPLNIFFRGSPEDALRVRMDDKISRIANQQPDEDEDPYDDLIGYLILYKVQKMKQESAASKNTERHKVL